MALIKKYKEITEDNQEEVLGSGLTGVLVNIIIVNTGDQTVTIDLYNNDDFYFYRGSLSSNNTLAITLDLSLVDDVLKCNSTKADVYFTANIITEE